MNFLLRFARAVVQSVMSQLMGQLNVVQEQALAPIRSIIQQVVGGMWIGEGANAFVEELSTIMIPGVGAVMQNISWLNTGLQRASDLITAADDECLPLVSEAADLFGSIIGF